MGTRWRDYVRERLPALDIRAEREAEIVDELALQLEAAYETSRAAGRTHEEAMRAAETEIPDWNALAATLTRIEQPRAPQFAPPSPQVTTGGHFMSGFARDLWRAARGLAAVPAYSAVAIATLTLGLGLGAAAFSLIDGVLLRPLTYPDADRLVLIKATVPPEGRETVEIAYPDFQDLSTSSAFAGLAALVPTAGTTTLTDPPSRIEGFQVTPLLFSTLGVRPHLGRVFEPADGEAVRPPVAMLSHAFWQRLGSAATILGTTIAIDEIQRTIIGVVPEAFRVDLLPQNADVYLPLTRANSFAANRGARVLRVVGRLSADVPLEQANATVATLAAQLAQQYPDTNRGRTFSVHPLQKEIVSGVRAQLWLVSGLVGLVLLVVVVNLAGLLLTRTVGRIRDVSLRLALGASRWRLARESMAEGLVITAIATMLGAVLTGASLNLLRATRGLMLPRLSEVVLNERTFTALVFTAAIVSVGVGLVPLLMIRRLQATGALRTGHETASLPALRLRSALIVGQTSLAFVLLAAAFLLAINLRTVLSQPLGFETSSVVTMRIAVPETRYPARDATVAFYTELLDTLRAHPSVQSAGVTSNLPLAGNTGSTLSIKGREDVPLALRPSVGWNWVSPGYFAAIGMPLVRGREFRADDVTRTPHVTVINETLARLHFGGEDPIGKQVYFGGFGPGGPPEWHEVIGVVGDVRHRTLDAAPDARAYDLFGQHWGRTVSLAVRTSDPSLQIAGVVRGLLSSRDPRLAVFSIRTTADLVSEAVMTRRLLLSGIAVFALVGLVIALLGIYGTVSYIVQQRTREVGVRLALGATAGSIRRLVLDRGLRMVGAGIALGLIGAFAFRQAIDTQVIGTAAMSWSAMAAAAIGLVFAATAACLVPAARAVRISPVEALRED